MGAGFEVISLVPGIKWPAMEHGFLDATGDPAQIERMFAGHRNHGVGLRNGLPGGVLGIDTDVKRGIDGPNNWLRFLQRYRRAPVARVGQLAIRRLPDVVAARGSRWRPETVYCQAWTFPPTWRCGPPACVSPAAR